MFLKRGPPRLQRTVTRLRLRSDIRRPRELPLVVAVRGDLESRLCLQQWGSCEMLMMEMDWRYIVWPSWARSFSFSWENLPRLIADPVAAGCVNINTMELIRIGQIINAPGFVEYYSGAFGGGVIAREHTPSVYWLGYDVFTQDADVTKALGMTTAHCRETGFDFRNVAFLELRGDSGLKRAGTGWKKPREYPCSVSFEHVDSAGEVMYWLLDSEIGAEHHPAFEALREAARGFGLEVESNILPPSSVLEEVQPWFTNPSRMTWFSVSGGLLRAGWQLAMMYYCAMDLKRRLGKRMRCMHLVAQIEKHPHIRMEWGRK